MAKRSVPTDASGIYVIRNSVNGKRYIGSSKNFVVRWRAHIKLLDECRHHSVALQRAWTKYGKDSFTFSKLIFCPIEQLLVYEQIAFNLYKPEYNILKFAGSCLGREMSQETRERIRQAKLTFASTKGQPRDPEAVQKTANAHRGMKRSAETCAKIAAAAKSRERAPFSDQSRANISAALKGKKKSAEHMAALQAGRRSRVFSESDCANISKSLRLSYENGTRKREKSDLHKLRIAKTVALLTDEQVLEARIMSLNGFTGGQIAQKYGIGQSSMSKVLRGITYAWVPMPRPDIGAQIKMFGSSHAT